MSNEMIELKLNKIANQLERIADTIEKLSKPALVTTAINGGTMEFAQTDKPKQLLDAAKVGDLVLRENGNWNQITDRVLGFPELWKTGNYEFFTSDGRQYHLITKPISDSNVSDSNVIEWQPLAPEGTAVWAWQMLKLGKSVLAPSKLSIVVCKKTESTKEGWCKMWQDVWGWQIYKEPEGEE